MRSVLTSLLLLFATNLVAGERHLDFHKLVDEGTYYGAYVGQEKIGYASIKGQIDKSNKTSNFIQSIYFRMEFSLPDESLLFIDMAGKYTFDMEKRHLISYGEETVNAGLKPRQSPEH